MPNLTAGTDDIRGFKLPGDSILDLTGAVPDGGDVQPSHDQPINPLPTATRPPALTIESQVLAAKADMPAPEHFSYFMRSSNRSKASMILTFLSSMLL